VPFLDVSVKICAGKIVTDLYRKPTAVAQYLLPSSCHPQHVTKNIPFSLGYRLLRIVSDRDTLLIRLEELKDMLLSRHYHPKVVDNALARVKCIDRDTALLRVEKNRTSKKVSFVVPYDPRFPPINQIVKKHFQVMYDDPHLKRVFEDGVQVCYRRNKNLRELLCRAKLFPAASDTRPKRNPIGWKRCIRNCVTCIYSSENKTKFRCTATGETIQISGLITCTDIGVVYVIECRKCAKQYVGKTKGQFKTRMNSHRSMIGKGTLSLARHFEGPERGSLKAKH